MKDSPDAPTHPPGSPFPGKTGYSAAPGSVSRKPPGLTFQRPCGAHVILRTRPNRDGFMLDWHPCSSSLCTPCKRVSTALKTIKLAAEAGP